MHMGIALVPSELNPVDGYSRTDLHAPAFIDPDVLHNTLCICDHLSIKWQPLSLSLSDDWLTTATVLGEIEAWAVAKQWTWPPTLDACASSENACSSTFWTKDDNIFAQVAEGSHLYRTRPVCEPSMVAVQGCLRSSKEC